MKVRNAILGVLGLTVAVALYFAHRESRPAGRESESNAAVGNQPSAPPIPPQPLASTAQERIPPFRPSAKAGRPFPKTLPPTQFAVPVVARAYKIAARIPEVLVQQPCYCWCDQYGHNSLLDCFATDHGAG